MERVIYEKEFDGGIAKIILDSDDQSFDIEYHSERIEHHSGRVWDNIRDEKWALEMFVAFAVEGWEFEHHPDEEFLQALEIMG